MKMKIPSVASLLLLTALVTPTQAALSKTAAYGICQAAIKEQFGKSTITRLRKIDIYRGEITVTATAIPTDSAKMVATCAFPKAETVGAVTLLTKYAS